GLDRIDYRPLGCRDDDGAVEAVVQGELGREQSLYCECHRGPRYTEHGVNRGRCLPPSSREVDFDAPRGEGHAHADGKQLVIELEVVYRAPPPLWQLRVFPERYPVSLVEYRIADRLEHLEADGGGYPQQSPLSEQVCRNLRPEVAAS